MMSMLAEDWAIPAPVVVELGPDILLIRPRRLAFLFRANWTSLVALLMLLIVMGTQLAAAWVALVLVAGVGFSVFGFVVGMLRTLGRRARFDRTRGELRLGWLRRRAPRPLASVKAIEVVDDPQNEIEPPARRSAAAATHPHDRRRRRARLSRGRALGVLPRRAAAGHATADAGCSGGQPVGGVEPVVAAGRKGEHPWAGERCDEGRGRPGASAALATRRDAHCPRPVHHWAGGLPGLAAHGSDRAAAIRR